MLNAEDSIVASLAFGIGHLSWSGPRSLAPWYLRRPVEVDPHRCPPGALRAEAQAEALPIVRGHWRPAELGDRREPREREELDVADVGQRLRPERPLEAEDRRRGRLRYERGRIP